MSCGKIGAYSKEGCTRPSGHNGPHRYDKDTRDGDRHKDNVSDRHKKPRKRVGDQSVNKARKR